MHGLLSCTCARTCALALAHVHTRTYNATSIYPTPPRPTRPTHPIHRSLAPPPPLDRLPARAATTQLRAHGTAVGLPSDGDMGNSEVGHNALGAGQVFDQGAKRVQPAIASGAILEGATWKETVAHTGRAAGAEGR